MGVVGSWWRKGSGRGELIEGGGRERNVEGGHTIPLTLWPFVEEYLRRTKMAA